MTLNGCATNALQKGKVVTKREVSGGRMMLVPAYPDGKEWCLRTGSEVIFDHNISHKSEFGLRTARYRKAIVMRDGQLKLPDGRILELENLVENQTANVVPFSQSVEEQLIADRVVQI